MSLRRPYVEGHPGSKFTGVEGIPGTDAEQNHVGEIPVCEIPVGEIHANEIHTYEIHAREIHTEELASGVLAGDRAALGRALTLVESSQPASRRAAEDLSGRLAPHCGRAHRVALTGVPGAGKSTLIDALGTKLTGEGHRVGVLAVDPTSPRSGGSILGDKTRMNRLANDARAFVRASPSSGTLGGVTRATRQAMTVLEAAGYDVVLVETVGVGQSEATVQSMVDCFCVLMMSGAGDDLQIVKRGVLELADVIAVNKADGDREQAARLTAAEIRRALPLVQPVQPVQSADGWKTPVVVVSALYGVGIDELWDSIARHREALDSSGELSRRRARGRKAAMQELLQQRLLERFESCFQASARRRELEAAVARGETTPEAAVSELLDLSS